MMFLSLGLWFPGTIKIRRGSRFPWCSRFTIGCAGSGIRTGEFRHEKQTFVPNFAAFSAGHKFLPAAVRLWNASGAPIVEYDTQWEPGDPAYF